MKNTILFVMTFIAFWLWIYGYTTAGASVGASEDVQEAATTIWMLCDAVAKSLFAMALAIFVGGYLREWFIFLSVLSLNNIIDELYFNPFALGWNEIAIFMILLVYYTHRITRLIYGSSK